MRGHQVSVLDGNTFMVSDDVGDVVASPTLPAGLFSFDTRYISTWILTVNGQRLYPLSVDDLEYHETRFFLVPGEAGLYTRAAMSVIRHREIGGNLRERLTILNHGEEPAEVCVRMDIASDFADFFDVKASRPHRTGKVYTRMEGNRLHLGYRRDTFWRETVISTTVPAKVDGHGLTFDAIINPGGQWSTGLTVETLILGRSDGEELRAGLITYRRARPRIKEDLQEWLDRAPRIACDCEPIATAYRRSLIDLASLRFMPITSEGSSLPAAGLPWFMTLFGRDSILTSLQTLPFTPELASTTLRLMARWQGTRFDDFREEDPGKILHELRYGESAAFEEQPHTPYYGSADATPLFVVLLDEYERWTADGDLVDELEPQARAALDWIDNHADLTGRGYISYQRRNTVNGLENQCWKDSWDSISYRDGRLPGFPRTTCELQGYAYDAKTRAARLARLYWHDDAYADRLVAEAERLRERFNRDFWIEESGHYAVAIEPDGKRVDSLTSNIGHLLWSGIVDPARAETVADRLLGPSMFSGWGVRTLSTEDSRFNPIGYHTGTVWPFDNSFIAWGMRRYGLKRHAARIAKAITDAAGYFHGRLPEAFAGYDRSLTKYPVQYPTACSPQAWSSGATLLLLRTMLGLEPTHDNLMVDPALPETIGRLELLDIRGRWGVIDAFGRGRIAVDSSTPDMPAD